MASRPRAQSTLLVCQSPGQTAIRNCRGVRRRMMPARPLAESQPPGPIHFSVFLIRVSIPGVSYFLLEADEPAPVREVRRHGRSPFVIAVDHAGRRIPRRLGDLGLPPSALERHTAWDPGALGVAMRVSATLDAPLIAQEYSRLVIDCNRTPGSETSIPRMAESLQVPGNVSLSEEEVAVRRSELA